MFTRARGHSLAHLERAAPLRFEHRPAVKVGAQAIGAQAVGAQAVWGVALAAVAVGALAIGAVAIGRLAIGRARIRRLDIDELVVRNLRITGQLQVPSNHDARGESRPPVNDDPT